MSYESVVVLVIVFSIPAGIFLVTSLIRLKQQEESAQAKLDAVFSSHKDDGRRMSL